MNNRPFSLHPRSAPRQGPQSIAEFIERANAQPGGFRGLNSADLRREIEASQNEVDGDDGDDDVDMAGDASDAGSDSPETKDVTAAREEILRAIHQTHQTSMFALDFVSLLLSKENPALAVTTLSPGLRDLVGIGTLGATMLDAPTPMTRSRVADHKMVAIGKRLMDLNKAADTALATSKRLQREIGLETKYWSEVLGVGEAGWQTFRLPHEPQTLGVKFGFSNTSPEFKNSGIAPLRRAEDGSVRLEHGAMGGGSKRVQVRILENGVVVGRSSLPQPLAPDAPLQDRVKESRDTAFAEELWHEINREGRNKLDSVVRVAESTATYDLDATTTVSLQLVTLGDEESTTAQHPGTQDALANSLCIVLGLLLSNAHRANELKRSEPTVKKGSTPPYSILRPLIAYHKYGESVQQCASSLAALISVLRSAGFASSLTMREPPLAPLPGSTTPASTSLANLLLKPPTVHFDLTITPASRLRILLKPTLLAGAAYAVSFLPPIQQQQPPNSPVNPLAAVCPAGPEDYADTAKLLGYLHDAVPRALAAAYFELAFTLPTSPRGQQPAAAAADPDAGAGDGGQDPDTTLWGMDARGKGIIDLDTGGEYGVHFGLVHDAETGRLELSVQGDYYAKAEEEGGGVEGARKMHREWRWPGTEESVGAVVKQVLSNRPGE
ncbi:subunit 17 of mediator complex-domain-containing protein [Parachaetomium inaequale]|uniref:Mediator of RNA polymerase II transcription subunit 17 n=1 Tax=Parachaetomium inaequale TaxID=2588326 RepID=A0AAN6SUF3_9PEZI|nr:subunit 17 of mediator complex-domain-containing protein [Parachaetomium inaequale]